MPLIEKCCETWNHGGITHISWRDHLCCMEYAGQYDFCWNFNDEITYIEFIHMDNKWDNQDGHIGIFIIVYDEHYPPSNIPNINS